MSLIQKRMLGMAGLLVACGITVGLLVWQDKFEAAQQETRESAQKLLAAQDKAQVTQLTLTTPTGTFVLERAGSGENAWQLTAPMKTAAESSAVEALLQATLELRTTGRVGGQGPKDDPTQAVAAPLDLALFGLQPPRSTLALKLQDGTTETLFVGKKNGYDGSLYVKNAAKADVGMVSGNFAYQLDQDVYKLREKRPEIFAADDIAAVQVQSHGKPSYSIERREHTFALTAPVPGDADEANVNQLFGALSSLRAKAFASEMASTPAQLKPFGLDKPTYTAVLTLKDKRQFTFNFGQITLGSDTHYFVAEAGEHPVLELGSDWAFKKLGISAQDLRDMHVLAFDREAVRGITITQGQDSLTLAKTHDAEKGDLWHATAPSAAEVQNTKVAALIYKLWNLKADSVAQEAPTPADLQGHGLDPAEVRIDLAAADGAKLGSILLGRIDGEKRYAASDKHPRIDRVGKTVADDISVQVSDYQEQATATTN